MKKIQKILIANRTEIACRVISACKALDIKSVAVYSEADQGLRHVRLADESICIGKSDSHESYLNIESLLFAAKKTNAQAVHPGYGFLSEQALFAEAVLKAGLVWIGPHPKTIEQMGNKVEAKKIADHLKIPTLPWVLLNEPWDVKILENAAKKIGFPLLLKAASGGGGRGMRLVEKLSDLHEKADSALREAKSAFGKSHLFLEKYLPYARHIEVQVLGDVHGNVIAVGERECSIQRRHQKVIEECPAVDLSEKTCKKLWDATLKLAKEVHYESAGTCEFLVDPKEDFYFLEMNTRIQVEHPVTEQVWGLDLVALQIQIAQGHKLPSLIKDRKPQGHAIEVRLYAEDPENSFMPSCGKLEQLSFPLLPFLRIETGYEQGNEISPYYDSMIAKVVCWGLDRNQAIQKIIFALLEIKILGVQTNLSYLKDVLSHPEFYSGKLSTRFLEEKFLNWKNPKQNLMELKKTSAWEFFGENNLGSQKNYKSLLLEDLQPKRAQDRHATEGNTNPTQYNEKQIDSDDGVASPLQSTYPGKVIKVLVCPGQKVKKGQIAVLCESMKMELSYVAPADTTVKLVYVKEGQIITAKTLLVDWVLELK